MQKKYKNKGFGCFGSNCFRKMRKSSYFNTKYLDFKNYLYKIRHYYVIYTKVINRTSLKSFREAVTQQKRTAPLGVDSIRVQSGSPFCVDFRTTISLTLNLLMQEIVQIHGSILVDNIPVHSCKFFILLVL